MEPGMMEDCVFCRIAAGEIPSYKIYEDDGYFAFLDITPRNKGHALVIPKKHMRWVWDSDDIGGYFRVVQKIALAQKKAFGTDFIVSAVIGEEVPHAHVWLVPRFEGDGHGGALDFSNIKEFSKEQMEEFAESIRKNL
jgi:histidine triad (HIT) family protein